MDIFKSDYFFAFFSVCRMKLKEKQRGVLLILMVARRGNEHSKNLLYLPFPSPPPSTALPLQLHTLPSPTPSPTLHPTPFSSPTPLQTMTQGAHCNIAQPHWLFLSAWDRPGSFPSVTFPDSLYDQATSGCGNRRGLSRLSL